MSGRIIGFVFCDRSTKGRLAQGVLARWARVAEFFLCDVCNAWGIDTVAIRVDDPESARPGECVVYGVDRDTDVAAALAYHSESTAGVFFAKFLIETIFDNGGNLQDDANSVLCALLHELAEALVDAPCNRWADVGDGRSVALEVCDPVQDTSYTREVDGQGYPCPDFVCPAYFDAWATEGDKLDHVAALTAPFSKTAGGYYVERDLKTGAERQVFGESLPAWKRDLHTTVSRRARARRPPDAPDTIPE